jgi:hypothetical protein
MRYFAGFLFAVGVLILVFILIVKGLGGGGSKNEKPPIVLSDYAHTGTVVQLGIDGPLTADQFHNGARITIGQTQNTIQTYRGYQNEEIQAKTYPNNANAYDEFLRALQMNGFTKGDLDPNKADERGYCPDGRRYIYRIISDSGTDIQRFWSSSCGQGNFGGNPAKIRSLFIRQIPDYDRVVNNLRL